MTNILISGYYGFNNVGDEAILKGLIQGVEAQVSDAHITVISHEPVFTAKKHGVYAIKRFNILRILRMLCKTDILISGGGSLLQDVTSKRSIVYYLGLIWLAKKIFRKKVMVYSQGIGPIILPVHRWMVKRVFNAIDVITVRDFHSKVFLESIGVRQPITVTADTVFSIRTDQLGASEKNIPHKKSKQKWVGISLRHWQHSEKTVHIFTQLCNWLIKAGYTPVLIPFQFHKDSLINEEIYHGFDRKDQEKIILIDQYYQVPEYLTLIKKMDLMISMRLHGLIFAVLMGVYPIGISYDPKIESFMASIHHKAPLPVNQLTIEQIIDQVTLWEKEGPDWLAKHPAVLSELVEHAHKANRLLFHLAQDSRDLERKDHVSEVENQRN